MINQVSCIKIKALTKSPKAHSQHIVCKCEHDRQDEHMSAQICRLTWEMAGPVSRGTSHTVTIEMAGITAGTLHFLLVTIVISMHRNYGNVNATFQEYRVSCWSYFLGTAQPVQILRYCHNPTQQQLNLTRLRLGIIIKPNPWRMTWCWYICVVIIMLRTGIVGLEHLGTGYGETIYLELLCFGLS